KPTPFSARGTAIQIGTLFHTKQRSAKRCSGTRLVKLSPSTPITVQLNLQLCQSNPCNRTRPSQPRLLTKCLPSKKRRSPNDRRIAWLPTIKALRRSAVTSAIRRKERSDNKWRRFPHGE